MVNGRCLCGLTLKNLCEASVCNGVAPEPLTRTLKNLCDASACDGVAPEPLTRVASIPVGRIRAGEIGRVLPRLWGFHPFPRVPSPFHHRTRPAATPFSEPPTRFSRPCDRMVTPLFDSRNRPHNGMCEVAFCGRTTVEFAKRRAASRPRPPHAGLSLPYPTATRVAVRIPAASEGGQGRLSKALDSDRRTP